MTTEKVLETVWRGPADQTDACRRMLDALGDGVESDRQRDLLGRIIQTYRRPSGIPWPTWPRMLHTNGNPVTNHDLIDLAVSLGWSREQAASDLGKLVEAGLLHYDEPNE